MSGLNCTRRFNLTSVCVEEGVWVISTHVCESVIDISVVRFVSHLNRERQKKVRERLVGTSSVARTRVVVGLS